VISNAVESATERQCIQEIPWYCAQTTVGRERSLEYHFNRIGVPTYLPKEISVSNRTVKRYNPIKKDYEDVKQRHEAVTAYFPGYILAQLDDYGWARVKTMLGVAVRLRWVQFGDGPVVVSRDLFEAIVALQPEPRKVLYKCGDAIEITSGPLAGRTGIYSHDANERVFALMEFLGRKKLIPFHLSDTRPAAATA